MLILLVPTLAFAAQNGVGVRTNGAGTTPRCAGNESCPVVATSSNATALAATDVIAALEQERMARYLYDSAAQRWNLAVFSRLSAAEARHAAVLETLAANAAVAVPPVQPGVYATTDVQGLYADLTPLMNASAASALASAALLEETSINDLRQLKARVADAPTHDVLTRLESASTRHLRALVRNLESLGQTYEPRILSVADYSAVVGAPSGCGRGPGRRGAW